MGSHNQPQAQYNTALTSATAESPYEAARRQRNERGTALIRSGDYRALASDPEFKVFYNFADPAERAKRRGVLANTRGQGVSAMGAGANPTLLALDKEHRDAESEEDAARDFQDTTGRIAGNIYGETADLQTADAAKKANILGVTASRATADANRPKWWQQLLGLGGQAGAAFAGSPAGSAALAGI
jgi:hypothetical protein